MLLDEWKATYARPAWKPVCDDGAGAAQLGGPALLAPGEAWPACRTHGASMQLFVQIHATAFPPELHLRSDGTLQLFYCSVDDGTCETWAPFSGSHLVRLLRGPAVSVAHPVGLAPLPAQHVEQWEAFVDYPSHEEGGLTSTFSGDEYGPATGDKLGGWPYWVQGKEYPSCPTCGAPMELVFQIDSEDNIPHMFGDVGCGHITQCPAHPHVLTFDWACS